MHRHMRAGMKTYLSVLFSLFDHRYFVVHRLFSKPGLHLLPSNQNNKEGSIPIRIRIEPTKPEATLESVNMYVAFVVKPFGCKCVLQVESCEKAGCPIELSKQGL